jgi:hypothetical protein
MIWIGGNVVTIVDGTFSCPPDVSQCATAPAMPVPLRFPAIAKRSSQ